MASASTCTPRRPHGPEKASFASTWWRGGATQPSSPKLSAPPFKLTEQGTRIADAAGGVTDEVWASAARHYDEDQLAALVAVIAVINAYNRLNVITRQPAGEYEPGQWE